MKNSRNIISTKQLFAILFVGSLDHGIVSISRWMTQISHQDAWISTFLGGVIALIFLNLILVFMKHFPSMTFIQIGEKVLGRYLGKLPGLIVFGFFLTYSSLSLRMLISLVSTWLLPKTPLETISISLLLMLFYLTRNGVKVLGRFQEAVLFITLPLLPITFYPYLVYRNNLLIMPIGGTGLITILKGALPSFYTLLVFFSLLILYPYVRRDASHQEIVKISNFAVGLTVLLKTLYVFGTIAVFGEKEIQFLMYPLQEFVKLLVFKVVERVEFLTIFFWLFMMFSGTAVTFYMANISIEQIIKIEGYKNTGFFIAIIMYFLNIFPKNVGELFEQIQIQGRVASVAMLFAVILVFGMSFILRKGESG